MGKRKTQSRILRATTDVRHGELSHVTNTGCDDTAQTPAIKLRIKIGRETVVGTKSFSVSASDQSSAADVDVDDDDDDDKSDSVDVVYMTEDVQDEVSCQEEMTVDETEVSASQADSSDDDDYDDDDDDDDDDKEWLNDSGDVNQFTSTSLLTTRQRALLSGDTTTYELPPPPPAAAAVTEDQLHRRQLRAKTRRQKAFEKSEKDKKETLDRLLKKQGSKTKCPAKAVSSSGRRRHSPVITYIQNTSFSAILLPVGCQFPLSTSRATPPLKSGQLCGVPGCDNVKRYTCARSGVALCSLNCYQRNLSQLSAVTST